MKHFYIFFLIAFPSILFGQKTTDQYKKQNRNAIALIVDGKSDQAINYFNKYLQAHLILHAFEIDQKRSITSKTL